MARFPFSVIFACLPLRRLSLAKIVIPGSGVIYVTVIILFIRYNYLHMNAQL